MRIFGSEGTAFRRAAGRYGRVVDVIPPARPTPVRHFRPTLADRRVVDAEFEVVGDDAAPQEPAAEEKADLPGERPGGLSAMVRGGRRKGANPQRTASRTPFVVLLALLSAASFWIAGGHALAGRGAGDSGLSLAGIETRIVQAGPLHVLIVTGRVENRTTEARPLPPVLVHAADEVVPARVRRGGDEIAAGTMLPFEARMRVSSGERPAVRVGFAGMSPRIAAR